MDSYLEIVHVHILSFIQTGYLKDRVDYSPVTVAINQLLNKQCSIAYDFSHSQQWGTRVKTSLLMT